MSLCLIVTAFRLKTTSGGCRRGTATATTGCRSNWCCAACGGKYDWRALNRVLVIQDSTDPREAKVFGAHAAPQGMCDNLINSLMLLANQEKDGDCPVEHIATSLSEKSRRGIMDGLRKFIAVDNHEAVKVGRHKIFQGGEAKVYDRLPSNSHPRRCG